MSQENVRSVERAVAAINVTGAESANVYDFIDGKISRVRIFLASDRRPQSRGALVGAGARCRVRAMSDGGAVSYEVTDRIARITLNRPKRGNGITRDMPVELAQCVERANLDPAVHVIRWRGAGKGFCGAMTSSRAPRDCSTGKVVRTVSDGSPLDPMVQMRNHTPGETWDPTIDYAMMSRNVRGFMSLFHSDKPVVCKVHGFCVAGGTDMALCSDLLVIADDAKIGYPPARVWGVPTTAVWVHRVGLEKAKRLLFTGDCLTGRKPPRGGSPSNRHPRPSSTNASRPYSDGSRACRRISSS